MTHDSSVATSTRFPRRSNLSDAISISQQPAAQSHEAGFAAWLRSRGNDTNKVRVDSNERSFPLAL